MYILKAGVGRAYVTLIEVGVGVESMFNQQSLYHLKLKPPLAYR
jgi:hypothetical protein